MNENELVKTIKEIEDNLIPFLDLDSYEKMLYYHIFRHTKLIGKDETLFVISTAPQKVGLTDFSARDRIRKLDKKGCIKIKETTRDGLIVELFLPNQIEGCIKENQYTETIIDIESIDFYKNSEYRHFILKRENFQCFYCFKKINPDNYVLDHVQSQVNNGENSYRNIVASCHECNSKKIGKNGSDFVRELYRNGIITSSELEKKLDSLEKLKEGILKPEI